MNKKATYLGCAVFTIVTVFGSAEERYTVLRGDNLSKIGRQFGVPYQDIMAVNDLKHAHIFEGQILTIPTGSTTVTKRTIRPIRSITVEQTAVDRYRAPGVIPSPVLDADQRIGSFSGEVPIGPFIEEPVEEPSVVVKPASPSYSYPPPSQSHVSTPSAIPSYSGVSPYNGKTTAKQPSNPTPKQKVTKPKLRSQTIPCISKKGDYIVQQGDSVRSISKEFGITFWELRTVNNIRFKKIYPGQILKIPGHGRSAKSLRISPYQR